METFKNIIITGTHHTPAIELINLLKADKNIKWNIFYIGHQSQTDTHLAHTIIPKLKAKFYNLDCGKFDRKNLDITILGIPKIISAFFTSLKLISAIKPNIVVSFGGYVSVPVIIAAFCKKIPSITHEQTLTISLSTKINSFFATYVAVSFPHPKYIHTGNLIRREIFENKSSKFNDVKKPFIYITGGNQGSIFLNNLIYELVPKLSSKFSIIHQTGKNNQTSIETKLKKIYKNYYPVEFVEKEDIGFVLNNSSLVISRSGANICQELDILDKSSILIPLPFTQQDEQSKNAFWLKSLHPKNTIILNQLDAKTDTVLKSIRTLISLIHVSIPQKPPLIHPLYQLINEIS